MCVVAAVIEPISFLSHTALISRKGSDRNKGTDDW